MKRTLSFLMSLALLTTLSGVVFAQEEEETTEEITELEESEETEEDEATEENDDDSEEEDEENENDDETTEDQASDDEIEAISGEKEGFLDVETNNRYYESIMDLYDKEIIQGYEDGNFLPYEGINRVEALKIILTSFDLVEDEDEDENAEEDTANEETESIEETNEDETVEDESIENETEEAETTDPLFTDIEIDSWYYDYIELSVEHNIIGGYPDNTFKPEQGINLAEALKMILRAGGEDFTVPVVDLEIDPAYDIPADAWYSHFAQYAIELGAIYLDADGNGNPDQTITRGQLADLIFRFKNQGTYTGQMEYGIATWYGDALAGNNVACGEAYGKFTPSEMTAAHKTLPCGTLVRVTNLWNMKTVEVTITDRGPYGEGRVIDLSSGSFEVISPLGAGVLDVEVEVINRPE